MQNAVKGVPGVSHGPVSESEQRFSHWLALLDAVSKLISCILLCSYSQLMTREPLEKLGFRDLVDPPPGSAEGEAKP